MISQKVLRILLPSRFCEVKGAGDNSPLVDDHDLVVGNCVFGIIQAIVSIRVPLRQSVSNEAIRRAPVPASRW